MIINIFEIFYDIIVFDHDKIPTWIQANNILPWYLNGCNNWYISILQLKIVQVQAKTMGNFL